MDDKGQNKLRIKFLGAIGTVTGSCTLLEYSTPDKLHYFLVDIGSYQNENRPDNDVQKVLKYYAPKLSKIFITHAHLDHIGLLPELVNYGFNKEVWCTKATMDLMKVMFEDAIKIQNPDICPNSIIKKINFNVIDDESSGHKSFGFKKSHIPITTGLSVNISRSAHILGSVSFNFEWNEQAKESLELKEWPKHIHFSGDIGPVSETHIPNILFKDHHMPFNCPKHKYIVLESTYGGQNRDKTEYTFDRRIEKLREIIETAFMEGQTILIPAFALDRAQQLLVDLHYWKKHASKEFKKFCADSLCSEDKLKAFFFLSGNNEEIKDKLTSIGKEKEGEEKKDKKPMLFKDLPSEMQDELLTGWDMKNAIDIEIGSPLINKINGIYIEHLPDDKFNTTAKQFKYKYLSNEFISRFGLDDGAEGEYSDENHKKIREKIKEILKDMLPYDPDYEKTKKNKNNPKANRKKIIISASGMCDEGAVVNLLKEYLPDEKAAVILTGFQAEDTNGRKLRELDSFDEAYKKQTRLHNIDIRLSDIKCEIISELIPYYSAHADQSQLVDYINEVIEKTPQTTVFLNHGTDDSRNKLKEEIEKKYNHEETKVSVELPPLKQNQWINLNTGETEAEEAVPVSETNNVVSVPADSNTLKYFNINNIHLYVPAAYDDNKISEIINFLLKQ